MLLLTGMQHVDGRTQVLLGAWGTSSNLTGPYGFGAGDLACPWVASAV